MCSIVDKQGGTDVDVKARIGKARGAFMQLENIWSSITHEKTSEDMEKDLQIALSRRDDGHKKVFSYCEVDSSLF